MHTSRLTRREFLSAAGILSAAAALPRPARAESRPITVSHSVSTFVYGQHLVAREKRFFDEEGVTLDKDMDTFSKDEVLTSIRYSRASSTGTSSSTSGSTRRSRRSSSRRR